jgi:hypothetical protein
VLDHRSPENEDVHATILATRRSILRHRQRRLRRRSAPGLNPGHPAGLQLGDDPPGDFVIEARPALAGARTFRVLRHRGFPRRAPEASPPALNPSRPTRPALSLSGAAIAVRTNGNVFCERFRERRGRDGSPKGEDPAQPGLQRSRQPGPAGSPPDPISDRAFDSTFRRMPPKTSIVGSTRTVTMGGKHGDDVRR